MVTVKYLYIQKSEHQGDSIENISYGYALTVCPVAEKVAVWSLKGLFMSLSRNYLI